MKVLVKRAFQSFSFLSHKKNNNKINKKADRLRKKFSSTPNTSVQQVHPSPISKSTPPYFAVFSFSKNISILRSGSTKW